jgi:hypothetical protein
MPLDTDVFFKIETVNTTLADLRKHIAAVPLCGVSGLRSSMPGVSDSVFSKSRRLLAYNF